ncbi:MAG: hypothetical protein NZL89_05825 [Leptospiraceae bacterium]|nr:hypothetical protein [Leptospiraceae bacterium]
MTHRKPYLPLVFWAKTQLASALLFTTLPIFPAEITIESKIPLGLAYDGQVLWIADAETRRLSGYDVSQKKELAPRTLNYDLRDLAYWAPYLVTVAANFVYVINPINGDLVDRIPLKGINDPVAIATDLHQAYIYNRADKKIHRVHLVDRMQFGAFQPEIAADIRSMTFYKGALWAIAKDGRAYKLSPTDGAQQSFVPLPEGCYGISFVDGELYVARPGQIRPVDFIEAESYVAAARRSFIINAEITLRFPWSEEERLREPRMLLRYSLLPVNPHQRVAALSSEPTIRFFRAEDGSHQAEAVLENKNNEKQRTHRLQFKATLFNLTHIFNPQTMKQYFRNPELPENVRVYLDPLRLGPAEKEKVENFRKEWLRKNEGKHPIFVIAALKSDTSFNDTLRCAALRSLGVPCRSMLYFDLSSRKTELLLQVYLQPAGWVSITTKYDPARPREFPLDNYQLALFSPDDIAVSPKPKAPLDERTALLEWRNIKSSAE